MRKGDKHSIESRQKMSVTRKGRPTWNKGKKMSEKYRETMRRVMLANPRRYWLGKKRDSFSEGHKRKIGEANSGSRSHLWKGGISTYERKLYLNGRRRALKNGAEGTHTQGEWENLKAQYNWTCPACGRKEPEIKLTEDHVVPLSKGGSDNIENIQPLCRSCNSVKHNKIIKYV